MFVELTDINILLSIVTGVVGIYAGYRKALKEAQDKGESNAVIITMLEHHEALLTKLDNKLEKSAHDRHAIEKELARQDERIETIFKNVKRIEANCKECRKKCD